MAEEQQQNTNPIQENVFHKGMMMDIDKSKIPIDKYYIAKDIKLFNKRGAGLIVTTADGNEFAFQVSAGFIPIGVMDHKGILYVLSAEADGSGRGEIGTYPSPNAENTDFDLTYSPLRNLSDSNFGNFMRTILFAVTISNRAVLQIKDSYDGSVDIYIADSVNQLRVVNSGFDQNGVVNDRDYTLATLATTFNLVLGTDTSLQITLDSITTGGSLKYGNYIFFIQYATEDYNTTHFVAESGPVPIYKGINTVGSVVGGSAGSRSDKKVRLQLSEVDQNYTYVRIGYIRYFSDYGGIPTYEIGALASNFNIDGTTIYIDITGNEGQVLLTEEEFLVKKETEVIPKSIVQIKNILFAASYKKTNTYDESLQRFARLIKIGYGTYGIDNPQWDPSTVINGGQYKYHTYLNSSTGYFRGEAYPFSVIFEFHDGSLSEAYPMNGVDMWDNLVPEYDPDISGDDKANYDGVFRFPNTKDLPFLNGTNIDVLSVEFDTEAAFESVMAARENNWIRFNVKAIHFARGERNKTLLYQGLMMAATMPLTTNAEFPMTEASSYENNIESLYQNLGGDAPWDRGPTGMQYAVNHTIDDMWGWQQITTDWSKSYIDDIPLKYAPLWRAYCPSIYQSGYDIRNCALRTYHKPDKYAFYSMDMLLQQSNDVSNIGYVMRVGKTITARPAATTDNKGMWDETWELANPPTPQFPRIYVADMKSENFIAGDSEGTSIVNAIAIGENGNIKPNDSGHKDFINELADPWIDQNNGWFIADDGAGGSRNWDPDTSDAIFYNKGMAFAKYIGLDLDDHDFDVSLQDDDFNMDIVNLYPGDPASIDILGLYPNIENVKFYKIGNPILIENAVAAIIDSFEGGPDWTAYKKIVRFRGDCFLQRNYFKQMYWTGNGKLKVYDANPLWDDPDKEDDGNPTNPDQPTYYNSAGMVIGIVTENSINVALRSEEDGNSFYPAVEIQPFVRDILSNDTIESFNMNHGYSQVLSSNAIVAFDKNIPYRAQHYKTRIRYSDEHVPGSFVDAYRTFRLNNYVDYSMGNGEIISINEVYDRLVSVQVETINEHYINKNPNAQGDPTILGSADVLSKTSRKMSNFGSQHQWSIIEADSLFGVDWNKNVIWKVDLQRSGTGSLFLNAADITKTALIEEWMNEIFEEFSSGKSDKTNEYLDDTLNGEGIVSGNDLKNESVYVTFHKKTEL